MSRRTPKVLKLRPLKGVETVPQVERNPDYVGGEGPLRPQAGAKLVAARIVFRNDGDRSVDIYCAFDMGERLIDDQGRQFDPIDSLYELAENTGCNDLIQPGFSTTETIVFEIPKDATPALIEFWDPNEGGTGNLDGTDPFGEISAVTFEVGPEA